MLCIDYILATVGSLTAITFNWSSYAETLGSKKIMIFDFKNKEG